MITNPNGAKCIVCGYDKFLERCHIIPKRFTVHVEGYTHYTKFGTNNIVPMCPNHHWEYDHDLMDDIDYVKMMDSIVSDKVFLPDFSTFICGKVSLDEGNTYNHKTIRAVEMINKWIMYHREKLDRLGYLKDKP